MSKKKVIILISLLAIIAIIFLVIKITTDFKKEAQIREEIKEVTKLFGTANIDNEDANAMLERRVITKGDYSKVEDSIK